MTREKLLSVRNHKHFNLGLAIVVILLIADLLFLNLKILFPNVPYVDKVFPQNFNQTSKPPSF